MCTPRLPIVSVSLFLPLALAFSDRPGSPAEPTPTALSAPPVPTARRPPVPAPDTRPVCSISPVDNQDSITAAIASCPNGSTVLFPPQQSYHQTDRIEVIGRNNLVIDGNGSTFTNTRPPKGPKGVHKPNWWLESNTNLVIKNMTVVGAFDASITRPGSPPVWNNIQWEHGFNVLGGDGIWITDVTVNNVWGEFVCVQPVEGQEGKGGEPRNVHIERLTGSGAARNGVAFTGCIDCWLEASTLTHVFLAGVDLESNVPNELLHNIHILDVHFNGVYSSAVFLAYKFVPGQIRSIEVRGITMSDAADSCYPAVSVGHPNQPENTTVVYDVVIEDSDLKARHHGVVLKDIGSGSVANNTITAIGPTAYCSPRVAVDLINSSSVAVSRNNVVGY